MRALPQSMHGRLENRLQFGRAGKQSFPHIEIQSRHRRCRRRGMARIRIAVEQLHRTGRRRLHHRIVQRPRHGHGPHRNRGIIDALGHRQQIRRHPEPLGRRRRAQPSERRDHLIEDQQNAMPGAQLAQALQIAARRHQHPRRPGHGLDDHGRHRGRIVQGQQPLQLIRQMRAPLGLAPRKRGLGEIPGCRQMVHPRHQVGAISLAVRPHPAHRHPAETHAVVAPLPSDEPHALSFSARAVIGQRDLQRGVDRLRPRIREKNAVQALRHDGRHPLRRLEGHRMPHLERRRVIQRLHLAQHRLDDFLPAMAGIAAPQAGRSVQDPAAGGIAVVHAVGRHQQARRGLELPVRRKRHP
ncbi:hypothetical protein PIGHUM_03861 [Pigmentiphaga humi]|uniref:Uncharacterized protein n=1 Tax=Pigmentiphaga humi TaxID=2478468 RepID=A0A3P4B752_9BURK|nr:hypothetical protein PIGHUM_03861 [Pigmentiphaga humi]